MSIHLQLEAEGHWQTGILAVCAGKASWESDCSETVELTLKALSNTEQNRRSFAILDIQQYSSTGCFSTWSSGKHCLALNLIGIQ